MKQSASLAFASESSGSKFPALERLDRFLERAPLVRLLGGGEEILVRLDRQIHRLVIVLGAGQARGVVGEICFRQVVRWEPFRHLLPARHALSWVGLGQRPQMPGSTVVRIGRNRPRSEIAHDFRPRTYQPVMVGEGNERFRVLGALGNRALQRGRWINRFFIQSCESES